LGFYDIGEYEALLAEKCGLAGTILLMQREG
jgi:hypothetical protein